MKYKVVFTPQALEDISKLDRTVIERIMKKVANQINQINETNEINHTGEINFERRKSNIEH